MPLNRRKPEPVQTKRSDSGITAPIDGDVVVYACGFASQHNVHHLTVNGEDTPRASFNYKKEVKEWGEKHGLTDSDYSINTVVESEPVENALHSVKLFLNDILERTDAEHYKIFLTGKGNFRDDVATILPYKGNRDNLHKPIHYAAIKEYLINHWDAEVVEGMEADDALAIAMTEAYREELVMDRNKVKAVVCSVDKDLRMVPGWHFNWNKDEKPVWVTEQEGMYNFYKQLLTGDMTDNIQGVPGIGPKKAEKILAECETEEEMYYAALDAYHNYYDTMAAEEIKGNPVEAATILLENAQLLWMVRELDEEGKPVMWEPPC